MREGQFKTGNTAAMTHGVSSLQTRAPADMSPFDLDTLEELRQLVRTDAGRNDVKIEIVARLVLVARKFFSDALEGTKGPRWWDSGVVGRGATYLAELRRWLDTVPAEQKDYTLIEVLRGDTDAQD